MSSNVTFVSNSKYFYELRLLIFISIVPTLLIEGMSGAQHVSVSETTPMHVIFLNYYRYRCEVSWIASVSVFHWSLVLFLLIHALCSYYPYKLWYCINLNMLFYFICNLSNHHKPNRLQTLKTALKLKGPLHPAYAAAIIQNLLSIGGNKISQFLQCDIWFNHPIVLRNAYLNRLKNWKETGSVISKSM